MTKKSDITARDWRQHPDTLHRPYRSTITRAPTKPLIPLTHEPVLSGPVYGRDILGVHDDDLTKNGVTNGEPLGERIIVCGAVTDEKKTPAAGYLD